MINQAKEFEKELEELLIKHKELFPMWWTQDISLNLYHKSELIKFSCTIKKVSNNTGSIQV